MAGKVAMMAGPTKDGYVRWIEQSRNGDPAKLCSQPFDVSHGIAQLPALTLCPPRSAPTGPAVNAATAR